MEFSPDSTYKQDIAETYAGYLLTTGLHLAIIARHMGYVTFTEYPSQLNPTHPN